jgi:hypothetical protein
VFALTIPVKGITGKAVFHPMIQTVGFQTAFSVNGVDGRERIRAYPGRSDRNALHLRLPFPKRKRLNGQKSAEVIIPE